MGCWRPYRIVYLLRKLSLRLPYIDGKRVAIWGWSYGGYTAAMALAHDDESVFKCAASVAPVTDWTLYGNALLPDLRFRFDD